MKKSFLLTTFIVSVALSPLAFPQNTPSRTTSTLWFVLTTATCGVTDEQCFNELKFILDSFFRKKISNNYGKGWNSNIPYFENEDHESS